MVNIDLEILTTIHLYRDAEVGRNSDFTVLLDASLRKRLGFRANNLELARQEIGFGKADILRVDLVKLK